MWRWWIGGGVGALMALLAVYYLVIGVRAGRSRGWSHRMVVFAPRRGLALLLHGDRTELSARASVFAGACILVMAVGAFIAIVGPDRVSPWAIARRRDSACRQALTPAEIRHVTGIPVALSHVHDDGEHCWVSWTGPDRFELTFAAGIGGSLSSSPPQAVFEQHRRSSTPAEALWLDDRALLLRRSYGDRVSTMIDGVPLRLEVSPDKVDPDGLRLLLDRIRGRASRFDGYKGRRR